jgi:hypothetical protein
VETSTEETRLKILNGEYKTNVTNQQRKHQEGTIEFEQQRLKMQRENPGSEPAVVNSDVDIQALVDKYKSTGYVYFDTSSKEYPREIIKHDSVIGRTWVISKKKYVDTSIFRIHYSSKGVHIVPINERIEGRLRL